MKKSKYSLLLKILGSVIIIGFLITRIKWDAATFTEILSEIDLFKYMISLSGVIIVLFLKSVRWNLLLKAQDCNYSYTSAFIAYISSYTIGLLTPGRVGEIARLYYVRQDKEISFYKSFKTIVTDRIFDFALLIWFGLSGLLFFYKVLGDIPAVSYLLISAVAVFIFWLIGKVIINWIRSSNVFIVFVRESWSDMFDKRMFLPWLLTILSYLLFYIANWFILSALHQQITLIEVGFILSIMSLVTLIPITLAGFGTREASLIFLFSFYMLSPETAVVFSVLQFAAFFLWGGIIGWVFWMIKPVSLAKIRQDAAKLVSMLKREKTI